MIHHFADLLDRKDDYWAMVPNRERFAFAINGPVTDKQSLQIATIGADTPFWEQIFECGDLQELTCTCLARSRSPRYLGLGSLSVCALREFK